MKKTITLISILILGIITNTFGQVYLALTFTAQSNETDVPLDSIFIKNLTQDADTMLYAPNSVLILYPDGVGVDMHDFSNIHSFSVSPNYPNPYIGHTYIDINIMKTDPIEIKITDLLGRTQASFKGALNAGKHTFEFYPGKESFYIFSAVYKGLTKSIKISNPLANRQNCKLVKQGYEKFEVNKKSLQANNFPFSFGDELRYFGYSKTTTGIRGSDVIEDTPQSDTVYLFQINEGIPCIAIPSIVINFQTYHTVQIGTQCWLKENLNIGTMIPGVQNQTDNETLEKYCFDDNPDNCDVYGGLYQGMEMMNYISQPGSKGICPTGWHIPTDEEWKQLEGAVDSQYGYPDAEWDKTDYRGFDVGQRLKSRDKWNFESGNNYYGFSALPSGTRRFDGVFLNQGSYTGIWSSTEGSINGMWYRYMEGYTPQVSRTHNLNSMGRPVRCLKDYD